MEQRKMTKTIYTLNLLSELIRNHGIISVISAHDDSLVDSDESRQGQVSGEEISYFLDSFPVLSFNCETVSVISAHDDLLIDSEQNRQEQVSEETTHHTFDTISEWLLNYRQSCVLPGHSYFDDWSTDSGKKDQELGMIVVNFSAFQQSQDVDVSPTLPVVNDEDMGQVSWSSIRAFEIQDPVFEETYIAHAKKDSSGWSGWIPDVPEVKCTAQTEKDLLKILADELYQALEAEEEEWNKQFGEVVKSGKLEPLREEALEDVRAGRFTYL